MCFGGGGATATLPTVAAPPVQRTSSPLADLYGRRRKGARGVFGNIFTSLSGAAPAATGTTTLGGLFTGTGIGTGA